MYSTSLPFKLCVYPYMSHFGHTASLFSLTSIVPLTIGIIAKRSQSLPSSPHYLHPIPLNMSSRISHTLLAQTAVTISLNPSSSNFLLRARPRRAIPLDLDNGAAWHLSVPPSSATTALGGICGWMRSPFGHLYSHDHSGGRPSPLRQKLNCPNVLVSGVVAQ